MFTIGEAARKTGLKVPTIRFYEQEGLIKPPARTESGRRVYSDRDLRRLSFVRHARKLGFELPDIPSLLNLADHPERHCHDADRLAQQNLEAVRQRIEQLRALEHELTRMVSSCAGGTSADCQIIESLNDHTLCSRDHA